MLYDKDIREPLFDFLEITCGTIRILEEKTMGKARADILMVTGEGLYGIEIKSDADTYTRLKKQVRYYDQYCDYCYAAVGTRHALHIGEHIPSHWGIITVDEEDHQPDFYILRRPAKNPRDTLKKKLSLLWRPELVHLLQKNKLPAYKQKSKKFVNEALLKKVPAEILHRQILEELFERDYTLIEEEIRQYKQKKGG